MSEEPTAQLGDGRSFEERVFARLSSLEERIFARFDALDDRFKQVDERLDHVEAKILELDKKSYNTNPFGERTLKAVTEMRTEMHDRFTRLDRRVSLMHGDFMTMRVEQSLMEDRLRALEDRGM